MPDEKTAVKEDKNKTDNKKSDVEKNDGLMTSDEFCDTFNIRERDKTVARMVFGIKTQKTEDQWKKALQDAEVVDFNDKKKRNFK